MTFESDAHNTIFNCTQCGDCCKGYGGTYVSEKDIEKIAKFIGVSYQKVLSDYCSMSGGKPLLAMADNGYCIFWNKNCTIHPVKPHMCRSWPYLKSILKDIGNWQAMASCCPGMQADASKQSIVKHVQYHLELLEAAKVVTK